jgi:hypothetical protein
VEIVATISSAGTSCLRAAAVISAPNHCQTRSAVAGEPDVPAGGSPLIATPSMPQRPGDATERPDVRRPQLGQNMPPVNRVHHDDGFAGAVGGAVGVVTVTLAGVPFTAAQAWTTAGCTSNASVFAAVAPAGPILATTGCATGTRTPSTLQADRQRLGEPRLLAPASCCCRTRAT